jgi:hypothetical protein
MKILWKVVAEIEVEPGDLNLEPGYNKGFMNVITWADSKDSIRDKLSRYLESFKWQLLSVDDVWPVDELSEYGEELAEMVERARQNPNAIILGCFHSYREKLQ